MGTKAWTHNRVKFERQGQLMNFEGLHPNFVHVDHETMDASTPQPTENPPRKDFRGRLSEDEVFWRDHYDWLLECGYRLQPRYRPDWKPSWEGTNKLWITCVDGSGPPVS